MKIVPFESNHIPAVCEFNRRMEAGNAGFVLPERVPRGVTYSGPNNVVRLDGWLALDGNVVRGGYHSVVQRMMVGGKPEEIGFLEQPLSEGVIDRKYGLVGFAVVRHFQMNYPLGYALGMGGMTRPLPRMLKQMKWRLSLVPFFFYVCRPARFLRHIVPLRTSAVRRAGADALAISGFGTLGIRALHRWRERRSPSLNGVELQEQPSFTPWADEVWQRAGSSHSFTSIFDAHNLDHIFGSSDHRFHRLQVSRGERTIGWVLAGDSLMRDHKQFGAMRIGSLISALAEPTDRPVVARAGIEFLRARGVDLIVSNQQDRRWQDALDQAGCLQATSNFALALAPKVASRILAVDPACETVHLGRGNGDGPIHL